EGGGVEGEEQVAAAEVGQRLARGGIHPVDDLRRLGRAEDVRGVEIAVAEALGAGREAGEAVECRLPRGRVERGGGDLAGEARALAGQAGAVEGVEAGLERGHRGERLGGVGASLNLVEK